jgi:hypothetical protein
MMLARRRSCMSPGSTRAVADLREAGEHVSRVERVLFEAPWRSGIDRRGASSRALKAVER